MLTRAQILHARFHRLPLAHDRLLPGPRAARAAAGVHDQGHAVGRQRVRCHTHHKHDDHRAQERERGEGARGDRAVECKGWQLVSAFSLARFWGCASADVMCV